MIGVDTNVLVRLFVIDDEAQSALSRQLFADRSPADPAFVTLISVVELVWLLDDAYDFSYGAILGVLSGLLSSPDFVVEGHAMVRDALTLAAHGKVDVPDYLIAATSGAAKCRTTFTFDKAAAKRIPGMQLLK